MINTHNIIQGDCLVEMKNIPDGSVDLVFTSPPYFNAREYSTFDSYEHYLNFIRNFMLQAFRVLSEDGFFVFNTSPVLVKRKSRNAESSRLPIPFDTFNLAQNSGFKYIDDIIWEKPDGASNRAIKFAHHRRPMAYKPFTITEYLFVFRKKDAPLIDRGIRKHSDEIIQQSLINGEYERTNIWRLSPTRVKGHPAPFPVLLPDRVIQYYSYCGDLVLDPFMGSGTTGISCKNLNRNFIGIELDPTYFKIAEKRINEVPTLGEFLI